MTYDILSGTPEDLGRHGTWIVRASGERIAEFIPGEYTAEDESLLGNAGELADALEKARAALRPTQPEYHIATDALRAAGRL